MKTLGERLHEGLPSGSDEGMRRLFRRSLYAHARPLAPLLSMFWPELFSLDREVVARVAMARTMREVDEEVRDYSTDNRNRSWWRRHGRVRISAQRLRREARRVFGGYVLS